MGKKCCRYCQSHDFRLYSSLFGNPHIVVVLRIRIENTSTSYPTWTWDHLPRWERERPASSATLHSHTSVAQVSAINTHMFTTVCFFWLTSLFQSRFYLKFSLLSVFCVNLIYVQSIQRFFFSIALGNVSLFNLCLHSSPSQPVYTKHPSITPCLGLKLLLFSCLNCQWFAQIHATLHTMVCVRFSLPSLTCVFLFVLLNHLLLFDYIKTLIVTFYF